MNQTANQGYNLVENTDEIQTSLNAWNGNFNKIDENVTKIQQNIKVLEDNFDTATTSNSNNFVLEDSASGYIPRDDEGNPLEIKIGDGPELEQDSPMVYKCNGTESGDYYFVYNSINYQFTMPTIEADNLLEFNTSTLVLSLNGTVIETTEASTGTLITLVQTPNPNYEQPITVVEGSSSVEVSNKNEFYHSEYTRTRNGVTFVISGNKLTMNNTATAAAAELFSTKQPITFSKGVHTLSVSGKNSTKGIYIALRLYDSNNNQISSNSTGVNSNSVTFDVIDEAVTYNIYIGLQNGTEYNEEMYLQLEKGETATTIIEPKQQTYPITLTEGMFLGALGTETDYKESNYIKGTKDNWKLVSKLAKLVFDGSENWEYTSNTFLLKSINNYANVHNTPLCNYFKGQVNVSNPSSIIADNTICFRNTASSGNARLYIRCDSIASVEDFKTWLSTHNLEVYYKLYSITETSITDTTLVSQLNNIVDNLQTYKGQTVVFTTSDNLEPNVQFDYLVNPLSSIEARLDLLEE